MQKLGLFVALFPMRSKNSGIPFLTLVLSWKGHELGATKEPVDLLIDGRSVDEIVAEKVAKDDNKA